MATMFGRVVDARTLIRKHCASDKSRDLGSFDSMSVRLIMAEKFHPRSLAEEDAAQGDSLCGNADTLAAAVCSTA